MSNQQDITILILAGGAGQRVGGVDKGLLEYQGVRLINKQLEWAKGQAKTILISANRNLPEYQRFGFPVLKDAGEAFSGPLNGVLKALQECDTPWLFVQPIDLPNLPENTLDLMFSHKEKLARCAYLESNSREHYLSMIIHQDCLKELEGYIKQGNSKVSLFHGFVNSQKINLGLKEDKFLNLNRSDDYLLR